MTAYWEYLDSFHGKKPVITEEIRQAFPETALPTDQLLKTMVANGIIDLYLPNDTHWGSTGHKAVATALARFYLQ